MNFLADHMLGKLARWLRFLGFDTVYPEVLPDDALIELAKREKRILLTRDKGLADTKEVQALYITSEDVNEQIVQVMQEFKLIPNDILSRCSLCNTLLIEVSKEDMEGKVPEKVYEMQERFWSCKGCGKYYWPGTHYENILKKLHMLGLSEG